MPRRHLVLGLLFAALFVSPLTAAPQSDTRLRLGHVVDESGLAVAALLTVRDANGTALQEVHTDGDGSFSVGPLPAGRYVMDIAAPLFETRRLVFDVRKTDVSPLRIVLGLAHLRESVTVTARRGATDDVAQSAPVVTVREAEDVRTRPLPTLGHVLTGATGVMVQQSTYGQVSPFLRGLTGYQVLNLVDGVRLNNATFRSGPNQYLSWIDPGQVSRVETMLGPASAQYGSDAMGGAIHVLTPEPVFRAGGARRTTGSASLQAGTADESWGIDSTVGWRGQRVMALFGTARREVGDLRAGGGRDSHHVLRRLVGLSDEQIVGITGDRQVGTGFEQSSWHAKFAARLGNRHSWTAWYQRSEQDRVKGYKDLWGGLGRLRSDFDPQRLQLFYTRYQALQVGKLDWLNVTVSVNAQSDGSIRQNLRATDTIVHDDVSVGTFGYAVQGGTHVGSRHTLVFGGEVYDEHVSTRRDETAPTTGVSTQKRALYPDGSRYLTTGMFLQSDAELVRGRTGRALVARLGGRLTQVNVRTNAADNVADDGRSLGVVDARQQYRDLTFNAALTWTPVPLVSLHALVGRGFRAPNLNDLGALGLNDLGYEVPAASAIGSRAFIGVSDGEGVLSTTRSVGELASERLLNYEAGVAFNGARFYARVNVFDAELHNPIVRRTLVFPLDAAPSALAGVPVTPIAPTDAQRAQGVVSVATAFDPRAVKAFVNEGRARYYGADAVVRTRISSRWFADATYSYLRGHDLAPSRPVRRLPPQQGMVTVRYQPGRRFSWIETSAVFSGPQTKLSGGDLTDERIGAGRRRSDITDFLRGSLIAPYVLPGADGVSGTADDVFTPTGETVSQIRDRVLPLGATINGVLVVNDSTRVPLSTQTPGFVSFDLRAGFTIAPRVDLAVALTNVLDRNYRVHGSGVDAPGRSVFATIRAAF